MGQHTSCANHEGVQRPPNPYAPLLVPLRQASIALNGSVGSHLFRIFMASSGNECVCVCVTVGAVELTLVKMRRDRLTQEDDLTTALYWKIVLPSCLIHRHSQLGLAARLVCRRSEDLPRMHCSHGHHCSCLPPTVTWGPAQCQGPGL